MKFGSMHLLTATAKLLIPALMLVAGLSAPASARSPCDFVSGDARRQCMKAEVAAQTAANREAANAARAERLRVDGQTRTVEARTNPVNDQRNASQQNAINEMLEGCRSGHWLDCARVKEFLPAESPEMLEVGLKGCALEDRGGCFSAAVYYEKYSSDSNHLDLAVKYYKTACDDGLPEACVALTSQSLGAAGGAAANNLVQTNGKLCNSGNGSACNTLGVSYYNGELVAEDRSKSLQFFNHGCKLGNKTACDNAAKTQAEFDKTRRDADRKTAESVAQNDPTRKPGTELSNADRVCLKDEEEEYYTHDRGSCIATSRDPYGAMTCSDYATVTTTHTKHNLENICKRPISIQEYCGSTSFAAATLLPGDVYTRSVLEPCRLTY